MFQNLLANKFFKLLLILPLGWIGLFFISCTPNDTLGTPPPTFDGVLTPYLTVSPSSAPDYASATPKLLPTNIPAPTATPFVYTVAEDDTLTGIALRYSVSLENLIASNPGIDPNFLTIGLTLTIPLDGVVASSSFPTATPVPIVVQSPVCYPLSDGSLQCMAVVENNQRFAVENIVALISLQREDGGEPISKTAITPLNWIPDGRRSVVVATFEAPPPQDYKPLANLLTAIPIAEDDQRYLQPDLQINQTVIAEDGKQAMVLGSLNLNSEQAEISTVWVAAFAYDAQKNIVGIRKWIADDSLLLDQQIDFDFTIYSLGPSIVSVEYLAEVRP